MLKSCVWDRKLWARIAERAGQYEKVEISVKSDLVRVNEREYVRVSVLQRGAAVSAMYQLCEGSLGAAKSLECAQL